MFNRKEWAKEYNSRPEVKLKRKLYKKTPSGKIAEHRYRNKKYATVADYKRAVRYGITHEEYQELLVKQNGCCAICTVKKDRKLHIDHDHNSKVVRGLLCGSCNRALGLLKDNTQFLLKAIEYLNGNRNSK